MADKLVEYLVGQMAERLAALSVALKVGRMADHWVVQSVER